MKLFLILLLATVLVTSTVLTAEAASKNQKAVDKFLQQKTTGGKKLSDLCFVIAGIEGNKNFTLMINNPRCSVVPTPEPQPCVNGTIVNGTCVPNPVPEPTPIPEPCQVNCPQPEPIPVPSNESKKVIVVGDLSGTAVLNQIKKQNPDLVVGLGDLGYGSNLAFFRDNYGALGNRVACVIGNHDSQEDGSSTIEKEALAYCGNDWYLVINKVLFVALNTNGDLDAQKTKLANLITPEFMQNISETHILTHKSCAVPPNSHHPVETKAFCDSIETIFKDYKRFYDSGHNHVMSASADGKYKQSGAGGKSHYTCGTNSAFPFCNASKYGFLEYTIEPTGKTSYKFIDSNGGVVN